MCLFQKHLEQIFPPSDQTEMSLLPALMPIPGEKKGITLSGILENMGQSWKEPKWEES